MNDLYSQAILTRSVLVIDTARSNSNDYERMNVLIVYTLHGAAKINKSSKTL